MYFAKNRLDLMWMKLKKPLKSLIVTPIKYSISGLCDVTISHIVTPNKWCKKENWES